MANNKYIDTEGNYAPNVISFAGRTVINPSDQDYLDAGYTLYTKPEKTESELLEEAKNKILKKIEAYDNSDAVNSFTFSGVSFWLDKADRVGLMNSTTILKNAGETVTNLWLGSMKLELPVDSVISMLGTLEIYALKCYDVTAGHKYAVSQLTTVDEVNAYDYKTGYPDKCSW